MKTETEIVPIHDLGASGDGVGRLGDGRVIFVPGALPGDRVEVRVTESRERFARGELRALIEGSPDRVPPPCPLAQDCGGCPWMALAYPAQVEAKGRRVRETLHRIAHIPTERIRPCAPAPAPLAYRIRARLFAQGDRIGYRQPRSRDLVDVPTCPVLIPPLNALVQQIREALAPAQPLEQPLRLELDLPPEGPPRLGATGLEAPRLKGLQGVAVRVDPRPWTPRRPHLLPFDQANRAGNAQLRAWVLEWLSPHEGAHYLDLFAGSGNFAHAILKAGGRISAVEAHPEAIAEARRRCPAPDRARYIHEEMQTALPPLLAQGPLGGIVLDPPRAGARQLLEALRGAPAPRLAYVSCDPATLARDLAGLDEGWEVVEVRPIDLMPHTAHVEAVAFLKRRRD